MKGEPFVNKGLISGRSRPLENFFEYLPTRVGGGGIK